MSKEEIVNIMRNFREAFNNKDIEKSLSLFAEDALWINPNGEFKGRKEIERYLNWAFKIIPDQKLIESGVKIIAEEDRAVYEHIMEGSYEGLKFQVLALCIWEFKGNKIQQTRTVFDRLALAKQINKSKMGKIALNSIINQMQKGL